MAQGRPFATLLLALTVLAAEVSARALDGVAPPRPTSPQVVHVYWRRVPGAAGYRAYYGPATGAETNRAELGPATMARLVLPPSQCQSLVVRAYAANGAESTNSNAIQYPAAVAVEVSGQHLQMSPSLSPPAWAATNSPWSATNPSGIVFFRSQDALGPTITQRLIAPRPAETCYAATNGSSTNSGLSAEAPWPLDYALAHCGATTTVMVLPGTYTSQAQIQYPYVTLKSQQKWGARIVGGAPYGIVTWPQGVAHHATIDGFEIASSAQCGVGLFSSNCIVRNCWIHHSGTAHPRQDGSGICNESEEDNDLVENNLCEYNGWSEHGPWDHGIYMYGNNAIVRNNICRYNWGCGIALAASAKGYIYNNVTYDNHYYGFGGYKYPVGARIYFYNNTLVETGTAFYGESNAAFLLTNNIIFWGTEFSGGKATVAGDYNLLNKAALTQAHGLVSTATNFVSLSSGLYWLTASAPARGLALATASEPTDFFGNPQSAVTDVGAFQYSSLYAADTRTLDPSGTNGADYWAQLSAPPPAPVLQVVTESP